MYFRVFSLGCIRRKNNHTRFDVSNTTGYVLGRNPTRQGQKEREGREKEHVHFSFQPLHVRS